MGAIFHESPSQIIRRVFNSKKDSITVSISSDQAQEQVIIMKEILFELKKMNMILSEVSDMEIDGCDIKN